MAPKSVLYVKYFVVPRVVEMWERDEYDGDNEFLQISTCDGSNFDQLRNFPGAKKLRKVLNDHLPYRCTLQRNSVEYLVVSSVEFGDPFAEFINDVKTALQSNKTARVVNASDKAAYFSVKIEIE